MYCELSKFAEHFLLSVADSTVLPSTPIACF